MKLILLLSLSLALVLGAPTTVCDFSEDVCRTYSNAPCQRADEQFFNFSNVIIPTYYYDVLSYGGIYLTGPGSIAGRAATGGNFNATSGSSVGLEIRASDGYTPYSLVAQRNVIWQKGSLGPSGEGIFAGSGFNGGSALRRRVTGDCGDQEDCQALLWNQIYRYWNSWSGYAYTLKNNTSWNFNRYGRMWIECVRDNQKINVIYASISDWNLVRSFHIDNTCNQSAIWLFNIGVDNNDVATNFAQIEPFPVEYSTGHVIYNVHTLTKVVTKIRDVRISAQVNGNIVAPNSNVIQVDGKVNGRVIALDSLQLTSIGRPHCPNTNV